MKQMQNKISKYYKLKEERKDTEMLWEDCYKHTFPSQNIFATSLNEKDQLYDATASMCTDQLASHLLSEMTPPYSSWFQLGHKNKGDNAQNVDALLFDAQEKIYENLNQSNFFSCIHQCYTDLAIIGTSCLLFEEAPLGQNSAFSFKALSMKDIYVEEGANSQTIYKKSSMTLDGIKEKFATFKATKEMEKQAKENPDTKFNITECVYRDTADYKYFVFTENDNQILATGSFAQNPFIFFRFTKSPISVYGRSPVMKALPDIKTANKIVELVLKNASLAVSGVWQADDDGVLNPANIELTPGAIIPKAMGSSGLTPLKVGSDFNVSDLVLKDVRENIKSALLCTQLQPFNENFNMSATEVLQRSSLALKILGSTYGRLQSELLTPLILRAFSILTRRGEIQDLVNKNDLNVVYVSRLGQLKSYDDVQNIMEWVKTIGSLGTLYSQQIDRQELLQTITRKMNISENFLLNKDKEYEKKILEFAYKLPSNLIEILIDMDDEDLSENFNNFAKWVMSQKEEQENV
ncbi:MAG: head-tail connector protein [Rickettsiales bacterium]|jgi:hypothetical protein|nr:head-tail connector protein [Rickettsiales bacterium]